MYKAEYESSWPLTIGINKYVVDPLDNAVTDAREVHRLLTDSLGFTAGGATLLVDEEATRSAIIKALHEIREKAGPDDRLLFFFAGHGESIDGPRGVYPSRKL
tara:strand:- start:3074 stop:3382 length:309 start_codon:yes stop_codon:yes gene_type:complete